MTQKAARPHALEAAVEVMVGSDGGSARDVEQVWQAAQVGLVAEVAWGGWSRRWGWRGQVGAGGAGCGLAPPAQVRGERASRWLHAPQLERFASNGLLPLLEARQSEDRWCTRVTALEAAG